jgi:hypothetical protein
MSEIVAAIPGWALWFVCPERTRLAVTARLRREAARLRFVAGYLVLGGAFFVVQRSLVRNPFFWLGIGELVGVLTRSATLFGARRRLDHTSSWEALAALPETAPERFRRRTRIRIPAGMAVLVILLSFVAFLFLALWLSVR